MIGIYKITSPSSKTYIGQSINIEKRFYDYKKCLSKTSKQTKVYRSFLKHGVENHIFEVVEECGVEKLNERERYWQDYYNSVEKGLNCRATQSDDKSGYFSEETKKRMSESGKKKILTEEQRKRISELGSSFKGTKRPQTGVKNIGRKVQEHLIKRGKDSPSYGLKRTEESKKKMSLAQKGKLAGEKHPFFGKKIPHLIEANKKRKKEEQYWFGKNLSKEHKEKLRQSNLGKKRSEETKKNVSISAKKRHETQRHPRSKYVLHLDTGVFFNTAKEASIVFDIKTTTLRSMLGGYNPNHTRLIYV